MILSFKKRLFLVLFVAGFLGVLSFLFVDLGAIIALVPIRPGVERPTIPPALKVLSLIQPTVLLAVAVLVGVVLAPRVGLTAPVAESLAAGRSAFSALRSKIGPQLIPGVVGALIGGLAILITSVATKPFLPAETIALAEKVANVIPLPTRLLYGGVTEELLIRWGLMTFFVWGVWRLFQRRHDRPTTVCFVAGILLSAFIFGLGHLPVAVTLLGQVTVALVLFVIVANSAFGIVTGYLYWKYGLESAIIAHMLGHIVLVTATSAGLA